MKERQLGCICQLNDEGYPIVSNYPECPVHKPDAITPKDTAIELMHKFWDDRNKEDAKILCTICVNEILGILDSFQTHAYAKILIPYYQQVKEEINNL